MRRRLLGFRRDVPRQLGELLEKTPLAVASAVVGPLRVVGDRALVSFRVTVVLLQSSGVASGSLPLRLL